MTEVEVDTDDHEPCRDAADEHLAHEILGRLPAARLVEAQHVAGVEVAGGVEQLELLVQRREQLRRRVGPHHLGGMAIEGDADRGQPAGVGELAHQP